jgi:hypothetical protein
MTPREFDTVEIRAARTMGEATYFMERLPKKIPAARLSLPPAGFIPRVRRVWDAITLRGGIR